MNPRITSKRTDDTNFFWYFIGIVAQKDDEGRKVENYGHAGKKLKNVGVGK